MNQAVSGKQSGEHPQTILVVDDTHENLTVIGGVLESRYRVKVATSGERALRIAGRDPLPDLVLLDVMMPEMDGYAVIRKLQEDPLTRDIPVIFVTAMDKAEDEEHGLSLGAVDYVTKPIRPAILLARVQTHLEVKAARDLLKNQNQWLSQEVKRRMAENELIKDVSLNALASLAEKRDQETGNHLYRTQTYLTLLMEKLKDHPRFRQQLTVQMREQIAHAAPLHDIGKVGIPDRILLKPGPLDHDEMEIMKTHSQIGGDALAGAIERVLQNRSGDQATEEANHNALEFLETARQIALYHHEHWSGAGYPDGLKGDEIPLGARLMTLADVFDALSSKRPYKEPFAPEKVLAIISNGRDKQFDPDIVDAFLACQEDFFRVAREHGDEEQQLAISIPAHVETALEEVGPNGC